MKLFNSILEAISNLFIALNSYRYLVAGILVFSTIAIIILTSKSKKWTWLNNAKTGGWIALPLIAIFFASLIACIVLFFFMGSTLHPEYFPPPFK